MPTVSERPSLAIVGAGLAGLTCGRRLQAAGWRVRLFDKGRAPGGRLSTRRVPEHEAAFDHGAQFFRARGEAFRAVVRELQSHGVVAAWSGRFGDLRQAGFEAQVDDEPRWVGSPSMSAIARWLQRDLDIDVGTRVTAVTKDAGGWRLESEAGDLGTFDRVVVAVPAAQAVPLLRERPALAARASATVISPCWAAMLAFQQRLALPFDGARCHASPLGWVARNASKPGRPSAECWVLHASPEWSQANLERPAEDVRAELLDAFRTLTGVTTEPDHAAVHRWRYALASESDDHDAPFLADESGLSACGDWLIAGRLEAAFDSGHALAAHYLSSP